MPLPKPLLATTPRMPRVPPRPLPTPPPAGRSKEPMAAACSPGFELVPATPLGSPNPPVCTACAGAFTVAIAELPEKPAVSTFIAGLPRGAAGCEASNVPTATIGFGAGAGITGADATGCGKIFGEGGGTTSARGSDSRDNAMGCGAALSVNTWWAGETRGGSGGALVVQTTAS